MLRPATAADFRRLLEIRDAAGDDALSDPAEIMADDLARLIDAGRVSVWDVEGRAVGFAAIDGAAIKLLVDSAHRGAGAGRALLADACARVKAAGHGMAMLVVAGGADSGRHYRAAGWTAAGESEYGGLVLQKPL